VDFYKTINCDVLIAIIVAVKFTQSPRPALSAVSPMPNFDLPSIAHWVIP